MIKGYCGSLYGSFRQNTFADVYPEVTGFITDYKSIGIPPIITEATATTLYYLLYAQYGNSTIASSDTNRFKYRLFSIVFTAGPTWEKKMDIQQKIRDLSEDDLLKGSLQIYNRADNPDTVPTTTSDDELEFISAQNTTRNKRGKLDAYSFQLELLREDVTAPFLRKFANLFLKVVEPEMPLYYVNEED